MKSTQYTIADLADSVGVSTSTLRAWERRYGLLVPKRTKGGHRVYDENDLRLYLFVVYLKNKTGLELKEIAAKGRESLQEQAANHFISAASQSDESQYEVSVTQNVLGDLAAKKYDSALKHLERASAVSTSEIEFANLMLGVMHEVGLAWQQGRVGVAAEHLVTARVCHLLADKLYRMKSAVQKKDGKSPPVALASSLPEEYHEIGILRVAIYLKSWGFHVHYLGANTPISELSQLIDELAPNLVCLSVTEAQRPKSILRHIERISLGIAKKTKVVIGGRGISEIPADHPACAAVHLTQDLTQLKTLAESTHKQG